MKITIKLKLVLAVSALLIVLFSLLAYLFISEKKDEISNDLFVGLTSYSRLSAGQIRDLTKNYLEQDNFLYFNRELKDLLSKNQHLSRVNVVNFDGVMLYDSLYDVETAYDGDLRAPDDEDILKQMKSENPSFKTYEDEIYYMKFSEDGGYDYVNGEEEKIEAFSEKELIEYYVVPVDEDYVVVYYPDFKILDERIYDMTERIIYMAVFAILLGIILSLFLASSVSKPVNKLVKGVNKVREGDFSARVYLNTTEEINFLADSFNQMAKDLNDSIEARVYKEKMGRELELAKDIQKQIIPKEIPRVESLDVSTAIVPAEEVGGDLFDFLPSYPGHFLFYLADVTGHGVPAGLVSSIANALLYGFSNLGDLKQILIAVNKVFKPKTMPNMFMTMCLLDWEARQNKLSYVSAGHEQIIYYSAASDSVTLLPAGGVAMGMVGDLTPHLNVNTLNLSTGDFVVIYSDGIPEAWKSEKESFGMQRFMDLVKLNSKLLTADSMKDAILTGVKNFMGDYKQADDITLIVLKKL